MHSWAEDAVTGRSEEAVDSLRLESQATDSHELEFVANSAFYAFWQLVIWAVYDRAGQDRLLEIAVIWQRHNLAEKERFAQTLRRKAATVAEITGEGELTGFCELLIARLLVDVATVRSSTHSTFTDDR